MDNTSQGSARLIGKSAIITGAGRGIGRQIALSFVRESCAVLINDLGKSEIEQVVAETREAGGRSLGVQADVSRRVEVERLVGEAISVFGKIDVLVNNAGLISFGTFLELTEEEWDRIYAVNVKGVFLCCQIAGRHMRELEAGSIINIASIAGKTAGLFAPHYASSKAAVISLTQALAKELAPQHIRVNAICPSFVETEMLAGFERAQARRLGLEEKAVKDTYLQLSGWHRMGTPTDVAELAVFLASSESEYITGQAINICALGELH